MKKSSKVIYSNEFAEITADHRTLRLQNTGDLFLCSKKDWENARHCHWFLTAEWRLQNKAGIFFEEYCRISGKRKTLGFKSLNFTREMYE